MNALKLLSRSEMRMIKGSSGGCRIALRSTDGDAWMGYSDECYTPEDAQSEMGESWGPGVYVSGYCCDSCGDDDLSFSNATPCSL